MFDNKRILIATGGTGGHINPALGTAGYIKEKNPSAEIVFVGTADKMESRLVPEAGYELRTIEISGFWRSFSLEAIKHNIGTILKLLKSSSQAKKIIKDFKPDLVIGFGGYVSGPVLRMAAKMGIPTAVHEQNAFPGKTNIALSRYVDKVMLTAADAEKYLKCSAPPVVTGLPVREEILTEEKLNARKALGIEPDKTVILSTGGSLGAQAINEVMCDVMKEFYGKDIVFVHGYGQNGKWVPDKLRENGINAEIYLENNR